MNFLALPFLFLFGMPDFSEIFTVSLPLLLTLLILMSTVNIPYYFALKQIDVSIVSSLFNLSEILLPLAAFIFLGEVLSPVGYAGFFLIVFSLLVLNYNRKKRLKVNNAFWLISISALLLVFEGVLTKYLLGEVDWRLLLFLELIFQPFFISLFLLNKKLRKQVVHDIGSFKKSIYLISASEICYFLGGAASFYALARIPLLELDVISDTQPIFIMFIALFTGLFVRSNILEKVDIKNICKKTVCFSLIIWGLILVINP